MATKSEIKDIENRIDKFCDNLEKEITDSLKELGVVQQPKCKKTTKKQCKKSAK